MANMSCDKLAETGLLAYSFHWEQILIHCKTSNEGECASQELHIICFNKMMFVVYAFNSFISIIN